MRSSAFSPLAGLAVIWLLLFFVASPAFSEKEAKSKSVESPKAAEKKSVTQKAEPKKAEPKKAEPKKQEDKKGQAKPEKPEEKPEEEEKEKAETTHKVAESPLVVRSKLSGTVESRQQEPVAMDLKRWADMTVVKAVAHGTRVKKGDVLIELDPDALEKKIRETKIGMPLKELELAAAELELDKLEKSTPLTLESARKAKMEAEADLAYYEDVTKPLREKDAKEDVRSREEFLAYAQEELNQLKKMYEADDLTEETEEIILRRAENTVREYQWLLEQTRVRSERSLSTTIPREHDNMKKALELRQINWRAGEKSTRDALQKKRLETKEKQRQMEETIRALSEHEEDLKAITVRAPMDGVVYYGMNQRGKWTTGATIEKKLIPGGKLSMREIVMTVVDPDQVHLRVAVPEDKLKDLAPGQDASIQLKWNSDTKIPGKLQSISHVPYSDGTFDAVVSMGKAEKDLAIFPGMKADAEVVVYNNKKALTIPKASIKKEGDKETVTLKGGKKVTVETGRTSGDKIEVTRGLKKGDEVMVPNAPKPAAAAEKEEKK